MDFRKVLVFLVLAIATILLAFVSLRMDYPTMMQIPPVQSYMSNEDDMFKLPVPTRLPPFPSEQCSKRGMAKPCVYFMDEKKQYHLGDDIYVGIELDRVKFLPEDKPDIVLVFMNNKTTGAGSTANVVYKGHGRYVAVLKALWVGRATIHAIVRGTATALENVNKTLNQRPIGKVYYCVFQYWKFREQTKAYMVFQRISSEYSEKKYCNLTIENYGYPLYCVRPKTRELQCTDWTQIFCEGKNDPTKDLSKDTLRGITSKRLKTDLKVDIIAKGKTFYRPPASCTRKSFIETWSNQSPIGFFYNNTWYSTHCNGVTSVDMRKVKTCLSNRKIRVFGDSTIRQLFFRFTKMVPAKVVTEDPSKQGNRAGHRPMKAISTEWNTNVYWALHGIPLAYELSFRGVVRPIHSNLDMIPANSNDIILFCIFSHFGLQHQLVYRQHMRRIAKSVKALLKRSPNVKIAVKAPHSLLTDHIFMKVVGLVGYLDRAIIFEEFKDLRDKVIFLDHLDLSISMDSKDVHPNEVMVRGMVDHFLLYACTS